MTLFELHHRDALRILGGLGCDRAAVEQEHPTGRRSEQELTVALAEVDARERGLIGISVDQLLAVGLGLIRIERYLRDLAVLERKEQIPAVVLGLQHKDSLLALVHAEPCGDILAEGARLGVRDLTDLGLVRSEEHTSELQSRE